MGLAAKAVKGMKDILPSEVGEWHFIEAQLRQLMAQYGYDEIRSPVVEQQTVFTRAIGQATDIVEKEMYAFEDKGGEHLCLRPEGTAQCVRAVLEHNLTYNQTQKLWYMGPMYRRERAQQGRYRQFYQLGVEAFGFQGPDVDIEMLLMMARLWRQLGISDNITLEINSLGTQDERSVYRDQLVAYFSACEHKLDEDSKRRLQSNPLRILDSKNPDMQALIEAAPKMMDYLGEESKAHFEKITDHLKKHNILFKHNSRLVRGLDYYTHTVYEWTTDLLGSQSAVCAGGRYDGLVDMMGGKATPSTGFAMGIERLLLVLREKKQIPQYHSLDIYLVHDDISALALAEQLRDRIPSINIQCHMGEGSIKSQFKKADKSGAQWALVYCEQERQSSKYLLKPLRERTEQQQLDFETLVTYLQANKKTV